MGKWFAESSWVGTIFLLAAVIAGLLSLNAKWYGMPMLLVAVLAIAGATALLQAHFRIQQREHEAQEARLAAAEQASRQNQARFHAAFTQAAIGMLLLSPQGLVLQSNAVVRALLGRRDDELLQQPFCQVLHPSDAVLPDRCIADLQARHDEGFSIELRCHGADAREVWVSLHCALYDDQGGSGAGLIYQLHDISSRRRAEGKLLHIAYLDSLTDLANRNCFHERLRVAVERGRLDPGARCAVLYLDLDRFKVVNNSLGHSAGVGLQKEVERRLAAHTRPGDLVARRGGDEFVVLVEHGTALDDVWALGERLLRALDEPMRIGGTEVCPLASISFSTPDGSGPEDLLRDADLAMYQAKAGGKTRVAVFGASLHETLEHRLQPEADLRRAIGEGQLSLAYQPLTPTQLQMLKQLGATIGRGYLLGRPFGAGQVRQLLRAASLEAA